jgi:hypothetical protein
MVRDHQPASVELARVELHVFFNIFRDVVAVHGLLGGWRFGHIDGSMVNQRARDGHQSHDGAAVVVARGRVDATPSHPFLDWALASLPAGSLDCWKS